MLNLPILLTILATAYIFWKTKSERVTNRSFIALLFWIGAYAALFFGFASQYLGGVVQLVGPLTRFAAFLAGNEILAQVWLASWFLETTISFTKARFRFPTKLVRTLDAIFAIGLGLILLAYLTGKIPLEEP